MSWAAHWPFAAQWVNAWLNVTLGLRLQLSLLGLTTGTWPAPHPKSCRVTSEGALVNAAVLDALRRPRLANTVTSNTVPCAKDPATASWTKRPLISSPPGFWIPMKWPPEG